MGDTERKKTDLPASGEYTIEDLRASIETILADSESVLTLFFLMKTGDGIELRYVNYEDKSEESDPITGCQQLKDLYGKHLKETILENDDVSLGTLADCDGNPNEIYVCGSETLPPELAPFLEFDIDQAINKKKFNFKKEKLADLYGYIVYIGGMINGMALFTKHYPIALIKREAFLLGYMKSRERFGRVNEEDMLRISGKAHLLQIDGRTLVLDINALERDMGFQKMTTAKAKDIIEEMKKWPFFADSSDLDEVVKDYRLVRKLVRARKHSPVFSDEVTWPHVLEYIQRTQPLKDLIELDQRREKVRLSTAKARRAFVALLDDDYLQSDLTRKLYVASHKKTVKPQTASNSKKRASGEKRHGASKKSK